MSGPAVVVKLLAHLVYWWKYFWWLKSQGAFKVKGSKKMENTLNVLSVLWIILLLLFLFGAISGCSWRLAEVSLTGRYDTARDSSYEDTGRYRNGGAEVTFTWRGPKD